MKKKILLSILVLLALFIVTGCNGNKAGKSNYKSYECRYSKDDNAEGKRYLTKYII